MLPDERQQLLVLLREADVLRVRLDDKRPDRPALRLERDAEPARVLDSYAERLDLALLHELGPALVIEQLRRTRPQHVGRRAPRVAAAEFVSLVGVGDVEVDGVDVIREADPLALLVVERNEEVLRIHELPDDLVDRAVELLHVLGRARQLGNAVQGVLHPGGARLLCLDAGHDIEYRALRTTRLGCSPRCPTRQAPTSPFRRWRPSSSLSSRPAAAGGTSRSGTASAAYSRTTAAS